MAKFVEKVSRDQDRREFLRKSAFAACATPIIVSMLVEKASAAKSWNSGKGEINLVGSGHEGHPLPTERLVPTR